MSKRKEDVYRSLKGKESVFVRDNYAPGANNHHEATALQTKPVDLIKKTHGSGLESQNASLHVTRRDEAFSRTH